MFFFYMLTFCTFASQNSKSPSGEVRFRKQKLNEEPKSVKIWLPLVFKVLLGCRVCEDIGRIY